MFSDDLSRDIRARFAHVDACPFSGPRVFFENAGGALTLNSVVDTSAKFAAIPDNAGRANAAGSGLMDIIADGRAAAERFLNAPAGGQVIVGESGTELIFRLVRAACLADGAGPVLGTTLEHPATRSAAARWAQVGGRAHVLVDHDVAQGTVDPAAYAAAVTPDTRVVTCVHTSPVTGMGVDIAGVVRAVRAVARDAIVIVDGIQHACHGGIDLADADVDGYVVSPYKVFSRHGYGLAWMSDRLASLAHDSLLDGPKDQWELGTRDAGAYATFSDVVSYFEWLGAQVSEATDPRARIEAAGAAIHAHEAALTDAMLDGIGNLKGVRDYEGVTILGGADNAAREGLVSFALDAIDAETIVAELNARGVRTHVRKADHYSGNVLAPMGLEACVRVSLAHYNTMDEVRAFLTAMADIA